LRARPGAVGAVACMLPPVVVVLVLPQMLLVVKVAVGAGHTRLHQHECACMCLCALACARSSMFPGRAPTTRARTRIRMRASMYAQGRMLARHFAGCAPALARTQHQLLLLLLCRQPTSRPPSRAH